MASPLHAGEPPAGVSGEGCPPSETVVLTQDGVTVGTDLADDSGRFAAEVDLDESPGGGRRTVTISCGAVEMTLSVRTGAASNPPWGIAGVAVALVLFTTSAIVVVRRRAERERRLGVS